MLDKTRICIFGFIHLTELRLSVVLSIRGAMPILKVLPKTKMNWQKKARAIHQNRFSYRYSALHFLFVSQSKSNAVPSAMNWKSLNRLLWLSLTGAGADISFTRQTNNGFRVFCEMKILNAHCLAISLVCLDKIVKCSNIYSRLPWMIEISFVSY